MRIRISGDPTGTPIILIVQCLIMKSGCGYQIIRWSDYEDELTFRHVLHDFPDRFRFNFCPGKQSFNAGAVRSIPAADRLTVFFINVSPFQSHTASYRSSADHFSDIAYFFFGQVRECYQVFWHVRLLRTLRSLDRYSLMSRGRWPQRFLCSWS